MMKQIYLFITTALFIFSFGSLSLLAQPDNTALGDVQVQSPEVAAIAKFSEASNNHFTGAAGISVPIEVLEEGNIKVPISLNYHASGIRVGAVASRVGMGWAVSGGGVISRSVLGIEDEATNGWLNTNWDYNNPAVIENVSNADYDGEPDLWTYSLPTGVSGKFIINKSINDIVQYPRTDVEIVPSGNDLEEFAIITPDGTKFLFGQTGNENYDGYIQVGELPQALTSKEESAKARNATGPRRQHTEWYLRKIVSYDDNYEINYSYSAKKEYILLSPASEQYSRVFSNRGTSDPGFLEAEMGFGPGGESLGNFNVLAQNNGRTTHPLYASIMMFEPRELSRITTSTTQIDFIEGTNKRQDLDAAPYSDSQIANNVARPSYEMYPLAQIKVSGIGGSPYCKQFNFSYDYFKAFASPLYSFDVRLKLNSIQEISCISGDQVNPYIFDYYTDDNLGFDFLPWRLTKARDRYGYHNGEEAFNNNQKFTIPPTTLSASHGSSVVTLSHGNARRQTEFMPMLYGTLKSVTYPEKGKNEFIYEANSVKEVTYDTTETGAGKFQPTMANCALNSQSGTLCCGTQNTTQIYNFDQDFIDSSLIRIYIQNVGCMSEPGVPYEGFVRLVIRDMVTNNTIGTLKEGNSTSLLDSITIDIKSAYGGMIAGRDYRFELETTECRGFLFFRKKQITEIVGNELVGGLRLKEQHSYDRSNTLLTSRFYDYSLPDESGVSSGIVYKKPYFGQVISGGDITATNNSGFTYTNFFVKFSWNSTPAIPLTDRQGYHITYKNVREYQNNGAYTDYVFKTRSLDAAFANTLLPYPIAPLQYFYDNGELQSQDVGGNDGTDFVVQHKGISGFPYTQVINQNDAVRVELQSGEAGKLFLTNRFNPQNSGFYLPLRDTTVLDGVQRITHFGYGDFPLDHLNPVEVKITNSDGEIHIDSSRFVHDIIARGDLPNQATYQTMLDRNMVGIPIEQIKMGNGVLVSGTRNQFATFHGDPYLDSVFTYETTWDSNFVEVKTGWELLGNVEEYYDFGKPKRMKRKHWSAMTFEYHPVHRLITKRSYIDYHWEYAYHAGSRLISKITDVDDQYIDFEYDGIGRLKSISERLDSVRTEFTYKYAGQDVSRPQTYIKQELIYKPVSGSALTNQTVYRYFDDISRPFQTVKQGYSADSGFDVVSSTEFDVYSRPFKQYEDFEIASSGGFSVAVPANTPFTLNTYEETALNRPKTVTPPDWHTTTFEYGNNISADAVDSWRLAGNYPEHVLNKETVIDPNNNKSIVFKDILGRVVLSRKEDQSATNRADTYNLFDLKGRPFGVIPPGATLTTTPNLVFRTYYDGANNPILKKIPDMDWMELLYSNRDLLVARQGGNLRADGKWMVNTYDLYGKKLETGLVSKVGPPDPNNVTPTEVWTKSYYDGDNATALKAELGITENFNNLNPNIELGKLTAQENFVLNGNTLTGNKVLRVMNYNDFGQLRNELGGNHYANSRLWKYFTYDFADNLIRQERRFHTTNVFEEHRDTLNNTYDHQGRLIDTYHSMYLKDRQHISQLAYTAKDELKTKFLGGISGGFLQEINFTYLNNGFLSGINPTMSASDLFQLNINYDQMVTGLTGTAQKNGNISQLNWKVQGKTEQTYGYNYDFQDRLTAANYGTYGSAARSSLVIGNEYGTTYSYDPRGNITGITRNGMVQTASGYEDKQIDNLTLDPHAGTNRLKTVVDAAPCPDEKMIHQPLDNTEVHAVNQTIEADNLVNLGADITYQAGTSVTLKAGFHAEAGTAFIAKIDGCGGSGTYETEGFVQRSTAPMEYDIEGNMTKDPNKGVDILYDYNNRPYRVTWANGNTVEWLYDGDGTKLQKTVKRNGVPEPLYKQDYFDRIEYRNDTLDAIYLFDAKVRHNNSNFDYSFYLKDHIQNTRVLFENDGSNTPSIISEHHYYSFGSRFEGDFISNPSSKYLFSTKEVNNDFGLGWSDFGYRFYMGDSGIPRFISIDPIAEKFPFVNPYNYAENKVPNGLDLHGLQLIDNKRAKINISAGGVSLKTQNLSNPTKAQIVLAKPVTGRNESGSFITTTFPTTIADVNFQGNTVNKRRPASSETSIVREVKNKFSGNSKDRRKQRRKNFNLPKGTKIITPAFIPPGSGGKGLGLLFVVSEGLNAITNQTIKRDIDAALHQNDVLANEAINIVNEAFSNEAFEAPEIEGFTTEQIQADLANFIFQGEFLNNFQGEDLEKMTDLARGLIQINGIPLRSKEERP